MMSEQEFLDVCIIPDKTPIVYKEYVIGHTVGENDCKKPINAVIYPFRISVNFKAQDFIEGKINVTHLALVFSDEGLKEIEVH